MIPEKSTIPVLLFFVLRISPSWMELIMKKRPKDNRKA